MVGSSRIDIQPYAITYGALGAGGRGIRRRIRILSDVTVVEYSGTRLSTRPRGAGGGQAGRPGRCWVERPDGSVADRSSETEFAVSAGEVLGVDTPGGGGYGLWALKADDVDASIAETGGG